MIPLKVVNGWMGSYPAVCLLAFEFGQRLLERLRPGSPKEYLELQEMPLLLFLVTGEASEDVRRVAAKPLKHIGPSGLSCDHSQLVQSGWIIQPFPAISFHLGCPVRSLQPSLAVMNGAPTCLIDIFAHTIIRSDRSSRRARCSP